MGDLVDQSPRSWVKIEYEKPTHPFQAPVPLSNFLQFNQFEYKALPIPTQIEPNSRIHRSPLSQGDETVRDLMKICLFEENKLVRHGD
ncbi:hypothetical protein ACE6H2_027930 [Prunus campanulata]